jgi:large subunit ribosomal protein L2
MSKVRVYKPTTPGLRKTSVIRYSEVLTKGKPEKSLLLRVKRNAGRNNTGKITVRHKGGGVKRMIRMVDFKRNFEEGFKVVAVEYDPNRTAFICLVTDIKSGKKAYILYSKGLEVGKSYFNNELSEGNQVELKLVPVGTEVSQVEINPGQGSKIARSAGAYVVVTARGEDYVTIKLASGEIRKVQATCKCVIGKVGNEGYNLIRWGKAGRMRLQGIRPTVRGKVMNPVDHPHGGGEARNSIGLKYPKTPWGKHALGVRTRNKKKASSRLILVRRKNKNGM